MTDWGYILTCLSHILWKKDKIGLEEKLYVKKSKKKCAITKEFSD